MNPSPFRLCPQAATPLRLAAALIEQVTGLSRLDRLYGRCPPTSGPAEFLDLVAGLFDLAIDIDPAQLAAVPRAGGTIVVANHPFGGIEGVLLARALLTVRPDVKVLTTEHLRRIPELRPLFIGVDNFAGPRAAATNAAPLREALRFVRGGGLLLVFPAGEVAHFQLRRGRVTDPTWQPVVGRLLQLTGAAAVPVHIPGRNSIVFQALGLVHRRLRTALLVRESLRLSGRRIAAQVGSPIPAQALAGLDAEAITALLRARSEALAPGRDTAASVPPRLPIAPAVPPASLAAEVATLPAERCLVRQEGYAVYCAEARQVPRVLEEIGRLREATFRAAGEGTGLARDLDRYDDRYLHLFVWNEAAQELVGAYRLGLADVLAARHGVRGLYTRSLFRYGRPLLDALGPAIELGRSFVRPEYQRSYLPLLLLWKGIGAFVAANPRYRVLFGPVSISNDYNATSRELLVEYLRRHCLRAELAPLVRPRNAFRSGTGLVGTIPSAADQVSELVAALEADGKGIPVLLRQYLKLGGRILGFNVDPRFSDALDGLIVVDLAQSEAKMLGRYMGRERAEAFLAHHRGATKCAA